MKADQRKYFFGNKKPCLQYLYTLFKSYVHQRIAPVLMRPKIEETIDLGTVEEEIKIMQNQMGNELVKPKSKWIKDAVSFFTKELRWLKIKEDNRIEVSPKKFQSKRKGNDDFRFFSNKLCRNDKKKFGKIERIEKKRERKFDKNQKGLGDFLP